MSRTLPTDMSVLVDEALVYPGLLVEFYFDSGTSRMWTGIGDLIADDKTWGGVGNLGSVSVIEETLEMRAAGISVTLSGVPNDMLDLVFNEQYQGRQIIIYYCLFNSRWEPIIKPYQLWSGEMDVLSIDEGQSTSVITVTAESQLFDLERARVRRYTDADQQEEYAGDRGFEFVTSIQESNVIWG